MRCVSEILKNTKKLTTDQCSALEVLYQESNVIIKKNQFNDMPEKFENWGEEFVISFDFYAFDHPPYVTNILHIYDYGFWDYDKEPEDSYGSRIPGCRTIQPWNIQYGSPRPIERRQ